MASLYVLIEIVGLSEGSYKNVKNGPIVIEPNFMKMVLEVLFSFKDKKDRENQFSGTSTLSYIFIDDT